MANKNTKLSERVKALQTYDILDTLPEHEYDQITELAAFICNTPIALISLLDDDRQFYKSRYGYKATEDSLDHSMCIFAILKPKEVLVIQDIRKSEEFKDYLHVTDDSENIFYAGAPLVDKNNIALGTLCVVDKKPRQLNSQQLKSLKSLADQVIQLFEYRKSRIENEVSKIKIKRKAERIQNVIEATQVGTWEWNVQTGEVNINEKWAQLIGYTKKELEPIDINTWYDVVHPEDRNISDEKIQACFEKKANFYNIECRLLHKNGSVVWINDRGRVIEWTEDGAPLIMAGTHTNITERKNTEKQFKTITNNIPGVVFRYQLNKDGRDELFLVSKGAKDIWGVNPEQAMKDNQLIWDRFEKEDLDSHLKSIQESAKNMSHWEHEWRYHHPDGNIYWHKGSGNPTKLNDESIIWDSVIIDITEKKETENKMRQVLDELKKSNERYQYVNKSTKDAIYDWDVVNDIFEWGEGFARIFGYPKNKTQFKLKDWVNLMHPKDSEENKEAWETFMSNPKQFKWNKEFRFIKKDGTYAFVEEVGHMIRDKKGKPVRMIGVLRDRSEYKIVEIQKQLEKDIADIFKENIKLSQALDKILNHISQFGDFHFSEIWTKSDDEEYLNLSRFITCSSGAIKFYESSRLIRKFKYGEGIPGHVWKNNKTEVWNDIDSNPLFIRRNAAKKAGLKTAIAIPLNTNEGLVGVLVLGSEHEINETDNLIQFLSPLENYLGAEIIRKQQQQELELLFKSAPEIIAIVSQEGFFQKVNPAFCNLLGYTEKELTSNRFDYFLHPDDVNKTVPEFEENIGGVKQAKNFYNRYRTKSGEYKWISWNSSEVFGEEGYMFAFGRDITDNQELQGLLKSASKLSKVGSWELSMKNGRDELYWSPMVYEIFEIEDHNYKPNKNKGFDFYEPESKKAIKKAIEDLTETGKEFDLELLVITAKGNKKWIRCIGKAEFFRDKCFRIYGSYQDVNERKLTELELVKFKYVIDNSKDCIAIANEKGKTMYMNSSFIETLGYSPHELNKAGGPTVVYQDPKVANEVFETLLSGNFWKGDIQLKNKEGDVLDYFLSGGPIFNERNEVFAVYGIHTDITQRKEYEKSLETLNEELKNQAYDLAISNKELEEFAYVASHDLQEPLRMVTTFLTQLEKRYIHQLDDKAQQYIHFAVDGSKRMKQIILDLLEFSRVGKLDEQFKKVSISEVVESIKKLQHQRINDTKAKVICKNLPVITTYHSAVFQILQNLIGNALKYSKTGVSPVICVEGSEEEERWVISVKDNGIGIDSEYFEKIFVIFKRLHAKDQYSGIGMGLSIVKKLVDKINGKVWVESELGVGSTFYFTIPKMEK